MISFDKVTKRFNNDYLVFQDVSFTISKGEFVFLQGPSGSGKTTIGRLLIGDLLPTSGEIYIDDIPLSKLKAKDLRILRRRVSLVFQDLKVLFDKTIAENIAIALELVGTNKKQIPAQINALLDKVHLHNKENSFPSQLSMGELKRVVLARALAFSPEIIFADEPTGNLDDKTALHIGHLLEEINKQGTTIIVATHNNLLTSRFKKRTLLLKDGKLKEQK